MMQTAWDYLKERMNELGISPKRSLGQNFLISDHIIEKIVKAAFATQPKSIIEVGPGLGALTRFFVKPPQGQETSWNFQVIELDRQLAEYWRNQSVKVTEADALQLDWQTLDLPRPVTFVSNLPYQISSSIVIERTIDKDPVDVMILMFQKEVAQRMKARLRDDTYGMLSVLVQTFWNVETLLEASSRDFHPPPKVASRVLVFRRKADSPQIDRPKYLQFVKAAFLHPRKLIVSNFQEALGVEKEKVLEKFKALGIGEKARAAELSVATYLKLFDAFYN